MAELIPATHDTSEGTKEKTISVSSSSDMDFNTGQKLSSMLLNEFNYLPWSRAIKIALGGRSKLGFITGTTKPPEADSHEYEVWLSKDQLVMSWILNSMERNLAEIFSYSDSSFELWKAIGDMYGNQNNAARIFQIHQEISKITQDGKSFVNMLGNLKRLWSELELYRPHTIDAVTLRKRTEEDRIFQLLASLNPEYEDLRSHILMNPELPSFQTVCATIQREEVRRKVMSRTTNSFNSDAHAYISRPFSENKNYKGKRHEFKCQHCKNSGHTVDRCWNLHPELKPKFMKDHKGKLITPHRANLATHSSDSFTASPVTLLNEFANYLQTKQGQGTSAEQTQSGEFISKFADILAGANAENSQGILLAFMTALELGNLHNLWVIDSGATDHMSNKLENFTDFSTFSSPVFFSIANGKGVPG